MAVVKSKFTPQTDLFLYQVIFKRACTSCCLHSLVQTGARTATALVPMSLLDTPRGSWGTTLLHAMGEVMEFLWQKGSLGLAAQMAGLSFLEYVTIQVGCWVHGQLALVWCRTARSPKIPGSTRAARRPRSVPAAQTNAAIAPIPKSAPAEWVCCCQQQ